MDSATEWKLGLRSLELSSIHPELGEFLKNLNFHDQMVNYCLRNYNIKAISKNEGPATIQLRVNTAGNTEQVSFLSDVFFHSCVFFKYKNIKVP